MVQPDSSTDTATFRSVPVLFYQRLDFHMVFNLLIAVNAFLMRMLTSLPVDEILLPSYMNWSTNFRRLIFHEEMAPSWLKHMKRPMSFAAYTRPNEIYTN